MLKISKKLSLHLSIAVSVILFVVCLAGIFIMPAFVNTIIKMHSDFTIHIPSTHGVHTLIMVLAYLIIAVIACANSMMMYLLLRVKGGKVFTNTSIAMIRGVSWCCFALSLIFCALGIFFTTSFIVAFMALFLGLCLRVVKNVIEEATEIKSENDLTV